MFSVCNRCNKIYEKTLKSKVKLVCKKGHILKWKHSELYSKESFILKCFDCKNKLIGAGFFCCAECPQGYHCLDYIYNHLKKEKQDKPDLNDSDSSEDKIGRSRKGTVNKNESNQSDKNSYIDEMDYYGYGSSYSESLVEEDSPARTINFFDEENHINTDSEEEKNEHEDEKELEVKSKEDKDLEEKSDDKEDEGIENKKKELESEKESDEEELSDSAKKISTPIDSDSN